MLDVMNTSWPNFIKNIISVSVQTDKKKKEEKGKELFSACLTSCRFKANSNTKQYKEL